jgi:hypothetical protein
MKNKNERALQWLAVGGAGLTAYLAAAPSFAQGAERVRIDAAPCVGLAVPEERLKCFDAQVERARRDATPAVPAAAARTPPPREAREREATVAARPVRPAEEAQPAPGLRARDAERTVAAAEPEADAPSDIVATVATLRETLPNSYLITLDNGQVWRQTRPEPYPLRQGAAVRIYTTKRWRGSYRLSVEGLAGFIQVEQVR